jgi:RNA polymerase sigma-70 factor (ECF subfamily)
MRMSGVVQQHGEQRALARLRERDIGGLEFLVRRYQVQAVRTAYLITRDRGLAEEVVQSAFLRAYERIEQFDDRRPFRPWFFRIVLNDALKVAAKAKRHVSSDVDGEAAWAMVESLVDGGPSPEIAAELSELRQTVRGALEKLSPAQRVAVVAKYYLGLTDAEIALRTGRAPGTVKWLLHAARGRLRTLLGDVR